MLKTTIILRMQGYWAVGSGKGGGNEVDSRIDRDSDGLPYVPGKMLKGLIKDACLRLKNAGNSDFDFVDNIFGSSDENSNLNRTATKSGKIYISDAQLSSSLSAALAMPKNRSAKDNLTRNLYSTAINDETLTADDKSLRGYEVAVPMDLYATLECDCDTSTFDYIKMAASKLVCAIGSHKSRGLGEVVIEFKDEA
jgi:CRISPR/Cas system CSM-associated protein Csm3 (group 7 of RAMP superfamily)